MTHFFKLSRRIARLRAPLVGAVILTIAACNTTDSLTPDSSAAPLTSDPAEQTASDAVPVADPTLASAFAGGIPIGLFHLPNSGYGSVYNGAMRNLSESSMVSDLAAIKARGGKIIINLTGSQKYFKDADGHFSLTKWKARVDRFRHVNFTSYINDGTIVGHYLIDEPYDAHNFAGRPVGGSTLEEMAKYSKGIWPGMATIVRGEPEKIRWSGTYRYLDAAWAQYLYRKGNVNDYLKQSVSDAQNMGLQLVAGLNIRDGGVGNGTMSASQVQSWGSTLLGSSYICAFVSWRYGDSYITTSSMKNAMDALRNKAEAHATKSCKS